MSFDFSITSHTLLGQQAAAIFEEEVVPSSSSTKTEKQTSTKLKLLDLPRVLLNKILTFLPDEDLFDNVSLTCKTLITDDGWKDILHREEHIKMAKERFERLEKTDLIKSWKNAYIDFNDIDPRKSTTRIRPSSVETGRFINNLLSSGKCGEKYIYRSDKLDEQINSKLLFEKINDKDNLHFKVPKEGISILKEGDFEEGHVHGNGSIIEFDGRVSDGGFEKGQLHGNGKILELNGREIRGSFSQGKLTTGKIYDLLPYLNVTVSTIKNGITNSFKAAYKASSKSGILTDDGRLLEGNFPRELIKNGKNLEAIFGAVLRALEKQYLKVSLPDSEGRILKGDVIQDQLYGEGRIIEANGTEHIGLFKNSRLILGTICNSSSIELVGEEFSSGNQTSEEESQDSDGESIKGPTSGKRKREQEVDTQYISKKGKQVKSLELSNVSFSSTSSLSSMDTSGQRIFKLNSEYFTLNGTNTIKTVEEREVVGPFKTGQLHGKGKITVNYPEENGIRTGAMVGEFQNGRLYNGRISRELCSTRYGGRADMEFEYFKDIHEDPRIEFEREGLLNLPIREGRVDFLEYEKSRGVTEKDEEDVYQSDEDTAELRSILRLPKEEGEIEEG